MLSSFFKKKPEIKPSLDEETQESHGEDKVCQLNTCWSFTLNYLKQLPESCSVSSGSANILVPVSVQFVTYRYNCDVI